MLVNLRPNSEPYIVLLIINGSLLWCGGCLSILTMHSTQGGCPHRGRHDIYGSEEMSEIEVTSLENLMLLLQ